jgi:glutamate racemase
VNFPIGVYDSGLGGLSVASRILQTLPDERIIYFADTAHVPYGERSFEDIRVFSKAIAGFLIDKGAKAVVAACNLSSAVALDILTDTFPQIPILGVIEPGARAAVRAANGHPIGVLATTGTIKSGAYQNAIGALDRSIPAIGRACPRFVPLVESGMADSEDAASAAAEYVQPLLEAGCRTIILGCTHYPFLIDPIRSAAGQDVTIVDPAEETAAELAALLLRRKIAGDGLDSAHEFYSSGESSGFMTLGSRFLGRTIAAVSHVDLQGAK